ncbi:MAG: DUF4856 domain-containing protein [Flavobacterium sp.]|nr:DUF4856 domain-containing protein [Pedobacter sp.]
MNGSLQNFRKTLLILAIGASVTACKKESEETLKPSLRASIDYAKLTDTVSYSKGNKLFIDANGQTTLDLSNGNNRYKSLASLNTYNNFAIKNSQVLDANILKSLYSNSGNPFTIAHHPDFAAINASGVQLRNVTASSLPATDAEAVRSKIESYFPQMAAVSSSFNVMAAKGIAGYLINGTSKYLVDAKGIEIAQIIQKSLIGAYQLDYINNFLLTKGLELDNSTLVAGKNYTALEHVWDEAYASLTLNPIFLAGATDVAKSASAPESFLGSYVWEYNKPNYSKIHAAFLKGRAAVVNNDAIEYKAQAKFIRTQLELALANASLGYLEKWKTSLNDGARAHALAEGLGFIYSLRFASTFAVDAKFSDDIITGLNSSADGFWGLTPAHINTALDPIKAKFNL